MSTWRDWFASKKGDGRPSWASFFSGDQFFAFKALIEDHFRQKGQDFSWGEGVLLLKPDQPGGLHQLGLVNLAQLCARHSEDEWPNIVTDHFNTLAKSQTEQRVLEQRLPDFERVRDLLSVRLWPEDYLKELDQARMIHRRDLPGTISALVYDLPSSIRNVTPEEAESWGKSVDELYRIALENVRETCIPDITEQELGEDLRVYLLSDESFFVASHALLLEDYHPRCVGDFGVLVGVPHRHVLLAYPIQTIDVVNAIPRLIAVIIGMERDGPGSISPRLYWLQHGEFLDLPYRIQEQTLHFSPPEAFMEMLNLLGDGDSGDADENDE